MLLKKFTLIPVWHWPSDGHVIPTTKICPFFQTGVQKWSKITILNRKNSIEIKDLNKCDVHKVISNKTRKQNFSLIKNLFNVNSMI